ncbi:conserved hypothetical protein [Histoplasma capsulatum var. duboisii H88]|uniref:Uncharacterized protein n=1 Tax=Ajellomyces capsulatus (strain H88) TaxID=544711 RepID=F0UU45_AJEC8|nr:conserved hypothetical protein [Histoplasma capsulatum var. duboisii H88]
MANPSLRGELNNDNSFQVSPRSTLESDFDSPVLSKISQSDIGQKLLPRPDRDVRDSALAQRCEDTLAADMDLALARSIVAGNVALLAASSKPPLTFVRPPEAKGLFLRGMDSVCRNKLEEACRFHNAFLAWAKIITGVNTKSLSARSYTKSGWLGRCDRIIGRRPDRMKPCGVQLGPAFSNGIGNVRRSQNRSSPQSHNRGMSGTTSTCVSNGVAIYLFNSICAAVHPLAEFDPKSYMK